MTRIPVGKHRGKDERHWCRRPKDQGEGFGYKLLPPLALLCFKGDIIRCQWYQQHLRGLAHIKLQCQKVSGLVSRGSFLHPNLTQRLFTPEEPRTVSGWCRRSSAAAKCRAAWRRPICDPSSAWAGLGVQNIGDQRLYDLNRYLKMDFQKCFVFRR